MRGSKSPGRILFFRGLMIVLLALLLQGCATIPKQSVELSQEVGRGIIETQQAYLRLLNKYFEQKREQIDQAVLNEYLPSYIANIRAVLQQAGHDPESFDSAMVRDITSDVIAKRDTMQVDLEKTRVLLLERIQGDQAVLLEGNAAITGLLASAVDVHEATSAMVTTLAKPIKPDFDFAEFENRLDKFLIQFGKNAASGQRLIDTVKDLLERKQQ